jgi:tetratricopeptide (TPR) repeat protein
MRLTTIRCTETLGERTSATAKLAGRRKVFILALPLLVFGLPSSAPAQGHKVDESLATAAPPIPKQSVSSPSLLDNAEQLYRTGKLDEAAQAYQAIIHAESRSALAYVGLVRVFLKQKKTAEAYAALAKALELAPAAEATRVAAGEVYFRQGKMPEAENEFATLVKQNTSQPRAYLGLSRIYRAASYYKHSKMMIDKAYALDAADPDIRKAWMSTLKLQERLKALQAYLASQTNDDADQRRALEAQLAVLQDEAGQPARPCRLATKVGAMETPLERLLHDSNHLRAYGLRVNLNGVSSKLELDTGASGILIDRKIAEKAEIKPVAQTDVKGIGDKGGASGYIGYADSIKIGDLEFRDCYVEVMDQRSVMGEDGLIGADVFSSFLVDIDFPHAKFRLSPLPPRPDEPAPVAALESRSSASSGFHDRYVAPEMKSFSPIYRFGHQLLIPTLINNLPPKLFVIDTGAFANAINPAAAREVTKLSSDSRMSVKGLSGTVKDVFLANELTLQFANLRQKNLDIVAFDTTHVSDSVGAEVSGFLGFSMLGMLEIKIDYRDGLVDFVYDPNHH